jgi:hypothetical protein
MGIAMVVSIQFQNGVLARYPDAVQELAVFALASGVFGFFNASQAFVAQLSNVFARSVTGTRRCYRFVCFVGLGLMLVLAAIAITPLGLQFLQFAYGIDETLATKISEYLVLLVGVVFLHGQRHFVNGLLVQAGLTGWVTSANFVYLGVLIAALVIGLALGLPAPLVLVGSDALAAIVQLGLSLWLYRTRYQLPEKAEHEGVTYAELARFFVPVATTGVMFALSRPVLYAFVARSPNGLVIIAALRIAFDFTAMFQQATNQFRHFFITFGWTELPSKRRFMVLVGGVLTLVMLILGLTPLAQWLWLIPMGIPANLQQLSVEAFLVLCCMPACILVRNYYHGYLMVVRRTAGMAWASILRVAAIYAYAQWLFAIGALQHTTAAFGLILGFLVEAVVVGVLARRQQRLLAT